MTHEQIKTIRLKDQKSGELVDLLTLNQIQAKEILMKVELRGLLIIKELLDQIPETSVTIIVSQILDGLLHEKYSINYTFQVNQDGQIVSRKALCQEEENCID